MNAAIVIKLRLLFVIHLIYFFDYTLAGTCWSTMVRNGEGRCTELLGEKVSREECCSTTRRSPTTAWSTEEFDSGTLFFWRVLGGGVPCAPCRDSCKGVACPTDKSCVLRNGSPRCVCASKCAQRPRPKGPVCGTDGRSYRNACRLKKHACRRRANNLLVAYKGICQNSCDKITCQSGKHCLLDQNLVPHCVNCLKKCPNSPKHRQVCGSDGLTYPSACHLREKTCRKGKAIPVAYKGSCRPNATCSKIRCRPAESCLKATDGAPRCIACTSTCTSNADVAVRPLCASNFVTYPSWCHMMRDSCRRGVVVDVKHSGKCFRNSTI